MSKINNTFKNINASIFSALKESAANEVSMWESDNINKLTFNDIPVKIPNDFIETECYYGEYNMPCWKYNYKKDNDIYLKYFGDDYFSIGSDNECMKLLDFINNPRKLIRIKSKEKRYRVKASLKDLYRLWDKYMFNLAHYKYYSTNEIINMCDNLSNKIKEVSELMQKNGINLSESQNLNETGEWDDEDEEMKGWIDDLRSQAQELATQIGGEVKSVTGFDKYQGPRAVIHSPKHGDVIVWYDQEDDTGRSFNVKVAHVGWITGGINDLANLLNQDTIPENEILSEGSMEDELGKEADEWLEDRYRKLEKKYGPDKAHEMIYGKSDSSKNKSSLKEWKDGSSVNQYAITFYLNSNLSDEELEARTQEVVSALEDDEMIERPIKEIKVKKISEIHRRLPESSLKEERVNQAVRKGDIFRNKNGVALTVTDVDDKNQVTYHFSSNGAIGKEYDCVPLESFLHMVNQNGYRKEI